MRSRFCLPVLLATALALAGLGRNSVRAGSFLGPCCYGARYTNRYPNRSRNTFGSYPCCPCPAWHPFFRPGLSVKRANAPVDGTIISEMPVAATPTVTPPIVPIPAPPTAP